MTRRNDAIVRYEVGNLGVQEFTKTVPQCTTCMSPYRAIIEEWFTNRMKARAIIARLETREGHGVGVSEQSIKRHFSRGHCTAQKARLLEETWAKAAELGVDIESYEETQAEEVFVVGLTVKKFREQLMRDSFQPDFKDGLAAAKLLHEMKREAGDESYDPNDMFVAISVLMSHVQTIINRYAPGHVEEAMEHFTHLLEVDPILQDLVAKTRETQGVHDLDYFGDDDEDSPEVVSDPDVVDAVLAIEPTLPEVEEDFGSDWNMDDDEEI